MNKLLIGQVIGALPALFAIVVGLMYLSNDGFFMRMMKSEIHGIIVGGVIGFSGVFLTRMNATIGAGLLFVPGVSWFVFASDPVPGLPSLGVALVASLFVITHSKPPS